MILSQSSCVVQSMPTTEDPLAELLSSTSSSTIPIPCSQEATGLWSYGWSDIAFIVDDSITRQKCSPSPAVSLVHQPPSNVCCYAGVDFNIRTKKSPLAYRYHNDLPDLEGLSYTSSSMDESDEEDTKSSLSSFDYGSEIATLAQQNSKNAKQRKVSFSNFVQIRTHAVTIGDHPCCRGGMAITCGWDRAGEDEIADFEMFEATSLKRRSGALRLTFSQRRRRLQECTGLSMSQLMHSEYAIVFGCSSYDEVLAGKRSGNSSSTSGGSRTISHPSRFNELMLKPLKFIVSGRKATSETSQI